MKAGKGRWDENMPLFFVRMEAKVPRKNDRAVCPRRHYEEWTTQAEKTSRIKKKMRALQPDWNITTVIGV